MRTINQNKLSRAIVASVRYNSATRDGMTVVGAGPGEAIFTDGHRVLLVRHKFQRVFIRVHASWARWGFALVLAVHPVAKICGQGFPWAEW